MLLKILPSVRSTHHVSAILTLGVLAVVISGQQQRRVIGFDAEGRITIQVQLQLKLFICTHVNFLPNNCNLKKIEW